MKKINLYVVLCVSLFLICEKDIKSNVEEKNYHSFIFLRRSIVYKADRN